jgi:hypothetical protein
MPARRLPWYGHVAHVAFSLSERCLVQRANGGNAGSIGTMGAGATESGDPVVAWAAQRWIWPFSRPVINPAVFQALAA